MELYLTLGRILQLLLLLLDGNREQELEALVKQTS